MSVSRASCLPLLQDTRVFQGEIKAKKLLPVETETGFADAVGIAVEVTKTKKKHREAKMRVTGQGGSSMGSEDCCPVCPQADAEQGFIELGKDQGFSGSFLLGI